jgi:hypothetical protein
MTGAGASLQHSAGQHERYGMNEGQGAEGAEGAYFRLVLAAAARRVLMRVFKRLMFFPCFRRIFRSFSRPRGIAFLRSEDFYKWAAPI